MAAHDSEKGLNRHPLSRRRFLGWSAATGLGLAMGGCARPQAPAAKVPADLLASAQTIPMAVLIEEARREGRLNTMSLRHTWANYGELLSTFRETYGLELNELNPDGTSTDEIDAVKKQRADPAFPAPDVLDVGLEYADSGKMEGLFAPYKVATWQSIPDTLKDPQGFWCANYYGALSFAVNYTHTDLRPTSWADLLKPEYKGTVTLPGDPLSATSAVSTVWAAGLFRTGSLDDAPMAGLEYFAEMYKVGNLLPLKGSVKGTLVPGLAPILIIWDYIGLGARDRVAEAKIDVVVPSDGVFGGPYVHAVSASAANPYAARLWAEYVFSDEGQLMWLEGYAHPVRYDDLVKRNRIPPALAARLPPAELYARTVFPTSAAQTKRATQIIRENWMKVVGVELKDP
jgi:putative spermidine/putrescine transport system substrate-binding protein